MNSQSNIIFLITLIFLMSLVATNSTAENIDSNTIFIQEITSTTAIPAGYWNIIGPTGLCISARNNNGRLVQQNCSNADDMMWTAQKHGSGYVITAKNGRVIDNRGQGKKNGNGIIGYSLNYTGAQIWAIETVNGNHVHFRNLQRNKCLDDTANHNVNQKYHLWDCSNGNQNQWFRLEAPAIPAGYWNIIGRTGLCISGRNKNGRLVQQNCSNADDMMWTAQKHGSGYVIRAKNGRVIDNFSRIRNNGNDIIGYSLNYTGAQIWAIEKVDGNHVHFRNLENNKCVDGTGIPNVNQKYVLWDCANVNINQQFTLQTTQVPVAFIALSGGLRGHQGTHH